MNFDQFINAAVPFILVAVAIGWVWWKFHEPLTWFFEWVKGLFSGGREKVRTSMDGSYEIVYR